MKILLTQKEKLNISKDIKILFQDKIKSSSLYGIIDNKVIISAEIKQLNGEEIEMIFLHELIHYQKLYLILKTLEDIHWFNPFIKIANKFGERVPPITKEKIFHNGIDLEADEGEGIYAVKDGIVIFADYDSKTGNTVKIKHKDGTISTYAYGLDILVSVNEMVQANQSIMLVESTGIATGHIYILKWKIRMLT